MKAKQSETRKPKDLGCMNSWPRQPAEYFRCVEQQHPLQRTRLGNCWTEYTCLICNIKWDVDSSD